MCDVLAGIHHLASSIGTSSRPMSWSPTTWRHLLDFDLVRLQERGDTLTAQDDLGTVAFMSPEQTTGLRSRRAQTSSAQLAPLRSARPEAATREARRMAGTYVPPADHTDEHPRAEDLTGAVHGRGAHAGSRSAREAHGSGGRRHAPAGRKRSETGTRGLADPPSLSDETTRSTDALMPSPRPPDSS